MYSFSSCRAVFLQCNLKTMLAVPPEGSSVEALLENNLHIHGKRDRQASG